MSNYDLILQCYRSDQISERQWQEHLKDAVFIAYLAKTKFAITTGQTNASRYY